MFSYCAREYKDIISTALEDFNIDKLRLYNVLGFKYNNSVVDGFVKIRVYLDSDSEIDEDYDNIEIISEYEKRIEHVNKAFEENKISKRFRLEYKIDISMRDCMNKIRNGIILTDRELSYISEKFEERFKEECSFYYKKVQIDCDDLIDNLDQMNPFHLLVLYKMFNDCFNSNLADTDWKEMFDFANSLSK